MTVQEDDKKLSRRARRRAEQEREADAPEQEESDALESGADADESDDDEESSEPEAEASADEDTSEDESSGEAARAEAPAPKAKRSNKPSKSEKKRAKQDERSATAQIRDRNKRLRDQAAQKRLSKRDRERKAAAAQGLDASEMMDDAFARGTHATTQFVRRHFNVIQWVVVLVIAGGVGWQIYTWRSGKTNAKASDLLMSGIDAELAKVGEPSGNPDEAMANPRPTFATEEERLQAAQKGYAEAEKQKEGSGTSILATLGKAGVLYDEGKFDEAKAAYEQVKASPLAMHDADVRLRSVEGIGLSLEAKGDTDGALKSFEELEKSDETGFATLGMFHEARVALNKGDKAKAKELVLKVQEKLAKDRSPYETGSYLERATRDLMEVIDPSTAAPTTSNYTPEQLEALKAQLMKDPTRLKKMLEDMGKLKVPNLGVPMVPGPTEAPPEPPPTNPTPAPSGAP